jgi:hypothetical protein
VRAATILALLAVLALAGCGAGREGSEGTTLPDVVVVGGSHDAGAKQGRARAPREVVAPSQCPAGRPGCRTTEGRIVYVERVDPDGDGDAHFVVVDRQGITLPELTAIDVRKGLRPHPLPGPGDLISAAGPVETGSYGQSQIHALELHVAEPR